MDRFEQELQHINWDFLCLCETRLEGEMTTSLKSGQLLYQNNSDTRDYEGGFEILVN